MSIVDPHSAPAGVILPNLEQSHEHPVEVGWKIYPFPPEFWRRVTVQAINPHLVYFGPLPQRNGLLGQIVALHRLAAYVYVIQDHEGDVFYVGKTINPIGRLANHRAKKDWWPICGQLTLLGIEAGDRVEADALSLRLELLAIRSIRPRHNITGVNW